MPYSRRPDSYLTHVDHSGSVVSMFYAIGGNRLNTEGPIRDWPSVRVRLPETQYQALDALAWDRHVSVSHMARELLGDAIDTAIRQAKGEGK